MRIWKLCFDLEKYDNLKPIKPFTAEEYQSFDGRKKKADWKKLPVKRMESEKKLELGDAPGFFIPVFSQRALEVLNPLINSDIELLELDISGVLYWGINVINVLDVIDYSKSVYRTYSDGKRIMAFQKYAFCESEELTETNIFKIKDEPTRWAFVSDRFKNTVEKNNLKGFIFKLAWDSETDGIIECQKSERNRSNDSDSSTKHEVFNPGKNVSLLKIRNEIKKAKRIFDINKSASGKEIAEQIYTIVELFLKNETLPKEYRNVENVAEKLGLLFGEALCDEYGWRWMLLENASQNTFLSVVSPSKSYSVQPKEFIGKILDKKNIGPDGQNDNTVMLLFNLIRELNDSSSNIRYSPLA